MQRRINVIQDPAGNALQNATVTVNLAGGGLATLYSDNGMTPTTNPVFTNAAGEYSYYAANGTYTEVLAAGTFFSETITGVILNDPLATGVGLKPGNVVHVDNTTINWYEEGTFVPTLTLGGLAVGITYSTQDGTFTRIGNRVDFSLVLILSSKGSSVGLVQVNGLPYPSAQANPVACANSCAAMAAAVNSVVTRMVGTTGIRLENFAAGVRTQLTDTALTAITDIRIAGSYIV